MLKTLRTILMILALGCQSSGDLKRDKLSYRDREREFVIGTLALSDGTEIKTYIAFSQDQHTQGLSGLGPENFANDEAMLFYYETSGRRNFWMPDTYFDLAIYFLDDNWKVIKAAYRVPHHPGRQTPPKIATVFSPFARHVLEVKADGPLAQKIQMGTQLKLLTDFSPKQIRQEIHSSQ